MTAKRIFLTGASGCIGHYVAETLIQETDHKLFLLVRNPDKLKFDTEARPGITVLKADLRDIEQFRNILQTIDVAILAATAWGGSGEVFDINVIKTIRLMNLLNPAICEQVIYFSTASILNRNNELLPEAGQLGTEYIRSKYDCFRQLPRLAIAPKITALYPTLVLGGDATHPYSHLSSGLAGVVKWINLMRFFKVDASFHFTHAQDIAQVTRHLVDNPPAVEIRGRVGETAIRKIVLGVPAITVNQAVEEICAYLDKRIYFRLPLTLWLANFSIAVFRIKMAPWDRFCLNYRHFTHQNPVTPETYGLTTYCSSFTDVLKIHGIPQKSANSDRLSATRSPEEEGKEVMSDE
jgi:nucleoside-diphosphate-sugar epimerase